jgi:hypothetical protein
MKSRFLHASGLTAVVCAGVLALAPAVMFASGPAGRQAPVASPAKPQAKGISTRAPQAGGVSGALGVRATAIRGSAWNADGSPIPNARLRLRDLGIGKIAATTVANDLGQFKFDKIEGGTYAIELVSESGRILTVGQTLIVAPGETVATFVRLSTKAPWFDGFFANAASGVAASAASLGVTALAPEQLRCVSPPCSR